MLASAIFVRIVIRRPVADVVRATSPANYVSADFAGPSSMCHFEFTDPAVTT
jgi:hypothetical protein